MKAAPSSTGTMILAGLLLAGTAWLMTTRTSSPAARVAAPAHSTAWDLHGNPVDPLAHEDSRAIVLIFLGIDCPNSNRYAPEIKRLHDEYSPKGVKIWSVYPDPDTPSEAILRHQVEYGLPPEVLRDPTHFLVARSRARVTPEAAVFLPGGRLVYHGRIDNREVDLGTTRPEATEHDLRRVLQHILQGEAVTPTSTPSVGCYIPGIK